MARQQERSSRSVNIDTTILSYSKAGVGRRYTAIKNKYSTYNLIHFLLLPLCVQSSHAYAEVYYDLVHVRSRTLEHRVIFLDTCLGC